MRVRCGRIDPNNIILLCSNVGNEELVVLLFQYGAKRNAKNRDEVSSHDIARQRRVYSMKAVDILPNALLKKILRFQKSQYKMLIFSNFVQKTQESVTCLNKQCCKMFKMVRQI